MTENAYDFWLWQTAGKKGDPPPYIATLFDKPDNFENPQPGFFRCRKYKGGPWQRVAIWPDEENGIGEALKVCIAIDDTLVTDPVKAAQRWMFMEPISEDLYRRIEAGEPWPDEFPGIGHNAPPEGAGDEFETLKEQVDSARGIAAEIEEVTDQEHADRVANLRDRLNQLSKEADKKRADEKRPHDEAAKAVQQKWKPLVDEAKAAADALRKPLTAYLNREEEKRKAEAEAARKAEADAAAEQQPEPEPEPEPVRAGGAHGRRASLRTQTTVEITDYDACLAALKDKPEVREAVEKLATRMARAGADVPGVKVKREKVAA